MTQKLLLTLESAHTTGENSINFRTPPPPHPTYRGRIKILNLENNSYLTKYNGLMSKIWENEARVLRFSAYEIDSICSCMCITAVLAAQINLKRVSLLYPVQVYQILRIARGETTSINKTSTFLLT